MFSGMSTHSVDSKGRIVLPAKFREALGDSFYVAKGFKTNCIQVMSKERFDEINEKIMELPANKVIALQYAFTATAAEVTPNASGRIQLPQTLRELAGIEGDAVVIGMNKCIEIWNFEKYKEFTASLSDVLDEALDMLRL